MQCERLVLLLFNSHDHASEFFTYCRNTEKKRNTQPSVPAEKQTERMKMKFDRANECRMKTNTPRMKITIKNKRNVQYKVSAE